MWGWPWGTKGRDAAKWTIKQEEAEPTITQQSKKETQEGPILMDQAVKETVGDLYSQTCKVLLMQPYNEVELAHLVTSGLLGRTDHLLDIWNIPDCGKVSIWIVEI